MAEEAYGLREGIIWKARGRRPQLKDISRNFEIRFDSTDHFSFCCSSCQRDAQTVGVKAVRTDHPTVYFELECPQCSTIGVRKIYL